MAPNHDDKCRPLIKDNPNLMVPWYLMASHAYHWQNLPIISDALYNDICRRLDAEWDEIRHDDKQYIDRSYLPHCCGNYVTENRMPKRTFGSMQSLLRELGWSPHRCLATGDA